MADFDPFRDGGATAVDDFDPFNEGAVPVSEFDPFQEGAVEIQPDGQYDATRSAANIAATKAAKSAIDLADASGFFDSSPVPASTQGMEGLELPAAATTPLSDLGPQTRARVESARSNDFTPKGFYQSAEEPTFVLPKPNADGTVSSGITRGVVNAVEGMTSPMNIALLPAMGMKYVGRAAGLGFAAMMGKQLPEQLEQVRNARNPGEKAEMITSLILTAGMTLGAIAHANSRIPAGAGSRPSSLTQAEANRATTQNQLRSMVPEIPYASEAKQVLAEAPLDGLVLAREKLRNEFNDQPLEIQQQRDASIDEIDAQLLRFSREDVRAAEERVAARERPKPRTAEEAIQATPENQQGGPPAESGTSSLFAQARRELLPEDAIPLETETIARQLDEQTIPEVAALLEPESIAPEIRPESVVSEVAPVITPEAPEVITPEPLPAPTVRTADQVAAELNQHRAKAIEAARRAGAPDPESAVQDAMIDLVNNPERVTNAEANLVQGATWKARDQLDQANAQKRGGGEVQSLDAELPSEISLNETIPAPKSRVTQEAVNPLTEVMDEMKAAKELSPRDSQILESIANGEEVSAAAKRIGISRQTFYSEQAKLLKKLQTKLAQKGIGREDVDFGPPDTGSVLGIAKTSKPVDWLVSNIKRLFTAEGNLPREVFERNIERSSEIKGVTRQITYAVRDLNNALQEQLGISNFRRATAGFTDASQSLVREMNEALLGQRDINTLPEKLRQPISEMRRQIDELSARLIDEGIIDQDLQAKVADNLGTYMTRSYRVFDDPKWAEQIPTQVRNKARAFLLDELQLRDPAKTAADANRLMNEMLEDWKGQQGRGQGAKLGAKDLSILIKRKDIAPELRALMGEYQSPEINYARSMTKMANLIGNQKFLTDIKTQGLGKWIFEEGTEPTGFNTKIAADSSSSMAPLNGLRTSPEIAKAFAEFNKSTLSDNPMWRVIQRFAALAKGAKTVGSVMTQARNAIGQGYFWAFNGHFDLSPVVSAIKGTAADQGIINTKQWRDYYRRMVDLGVVDQSARAGELRDLMNDVGVKDASINQFETSVWKHTMDSIKKGTIGIAEKAYAVPDDVGKIVGFENESANLKKINPSWTPEQIDAEAAKRVRDLYPTYSMVPEAIKAFRRQPILGPFVSFAYEAMRTALNSIKLAQREIRSSNPTERAVGAKRLAGQVAVLGSTAALAVASRAFLGISNKEEDDARRFLPEWDKNSGLLFTDKGDGTLGYVNLSYANPYSYLTDPILAASVSLSEGEDVEKAMMRSFGELVSPYVSENILASSLLDIARNQTATGRTLWSPQDTAEDKFKAGATRIAEAMEPGTLTRLRKKIIPSFQGESAPDGRKLSPTQEIASELTGFKKQTMDYRNALGFKGFKFQRDNQDAESIFRSKIYRGSEQDIQEAYNRSETARFKVWQDLYKDSVAAQRRGVPKSDVQAILIERDVPKAKAEAIVNGRYIPYTPSQDTIKKLRKPLPALKSPMEGKVLSGS